MSAPLNEAPEFEIARFLKRLQWLVIAAAVFWLVWMLGPILTPFVLAALLGWLGDPLVDRLERAGRSRPLAVTIVFVLMSLVLALGLISTEAASALRSRNCWSR